jgi:hypothetical protein
MLDRFSIHQINALKFLLISLSSVVVEKRHGAMQKLFKKREKRVEKMDKCPRYLKQWVLRCPPEKREMNKIAPAL